MKRVMFELTMPNVGSWDGRFSGANKVYTVAHKLLEKDNQSILNNSWYYDFGDGWEQE